MATWNWEARVTPDPEIGFLDEAVKELSDDPEFIAEGLAINFAERIARVMESKEITKAEPGQKDGGVESVHHALPGRATQSHAALDCESVSGVGLNCSNSCGRGYFRRGISQHTRGEAPCLRGKSIASQRQGNRYGLNPYRVNLLRRHAAVYDEFGAGHVGRVVRREEQYPWAISSGSPMRPIGMRLRTYCLRSASWEPKLPSS